MLIIRVALRPLKQELDGQRPGDWNRFSDSTGSKASNVNVVLYLMRAIGDSFFARPRVIMKQFPFFQDGSGHLGTPVKVGLPLPRRKACFVRRNV